MVKFINWLTGNEMYVAEDRVEEYLAAGHKIAGTPMAVKAEPKPEPKKTRKKASKGSR